MAVSLEASLGTNVPMCLVLFCAFALLRPRVPAIYAPRVRLQTLQQRPPELGDGFWDWLGPLLALDERAVLASAGLDVVMYLRFVRLSSQLFAVATVLGWVMLVPLMHFEKPTAEQMTEMGVHNATGNETGNASSTHTWLQGLSITHVPDASPVLWGHVTYAYLFTVLALVLLHVNYRGYAALRYETMRVGGVHRCWVLVTDIPVEYADEERLHNYFVLLYPGSFVCVAQARDTSKLDRILTERVKVVEWLEGLLHAERCTQKRPAHRRFSNWPLGDKLGLGALMGSKHDSIDWYQAELQRLNSRVETSVALALADTYPPPKAAGESTSTLKQSMLPLTYLSYEEEDTCHMRRRIHTYRACHLQP
jgi:hypothetical protein